MDECLISDPTQTLPQLSKKCIPYQHCFIVEVLQYYIIQLEKLILFFICTFIFSFSFFVFIFYYTSNTKKFSLHLTAWNQICSVRGKRWPTGRGLKTNPRPQDQTKDPFPALPHPPPPLPRLGLSGILETFGQPQLETEEPFSTLPTLPSLMSRSKIIRGLLVNLSS